eukprot:m.135998 g.135998  ORF g.135998 m.135998 type:complete len:100 (-) comp10345_c0_seq1:21-320(-)
MRVVVQFSGGAEFLVDNVKEHDVELKEKEGNQKWTLLDLLFFIRDNLIQERVELFMQDDTVRPGILVLVNGTDWELLDGVEYELEENDTIVFISTLHGG